MYAKLAIRGLDMIPRYEPVKLVYKFWRVRPPSNKYPLPVTTPDLDNYAYLVTNALSGVCYYDDNQIVDMVVSLRWATTYHPPGVEITIISPVEA